MKQITLESIKAIFAEKNIELSLEVSGSKLPYHHEIVLRPISTNIVPTAPVLKGIFMKKVHKEATDTATTRIHPSVPAAALWEILKKYPIRAVTLDGKTVYYHVENDMLCEKTK